MLKKILILAILVTPFLNGCNQDGFETTDSGLRYQLVVDGEGPSPEDGSVILMSISYLDQNSNVLFTTVESPEGPLPLNYIDSMFVRSGGIEEGIRMIKRGDSLVLMFPIEDLYENTFGMDLPDSLERGSDVTVCMKAEEVYTQEEYKAYYTEQMFIQQENARKAMEAQNAIEAGILNDYLASENIEAETHESGLRYRIIEQGSGELAQNGQMVHVNYTGRLLNGELFDTSNADLAQEEGVYNPQRTYEPYAFELGRGGVIRGWDVGIGLLNPGSKAVLYVPSSMGYGPRDTPVIPANSILVFDVELVKVENL